MKKNRNSRLFFIFLFLMISISFFMLLCFQLESDYFWHIKAGEYMSQHGILNYDVFSWFVKGKYWMSHEWLFEILLYGLKKIFGIYHVYIYCFSCLLFLYVFLFLSNKKSFLKNIPYSLFFLLFFSLICSNYIQARPHMIDFILLAITIFCLYDLYETEESKKIYLLPAVSMLWANVHGGSSNLAYLFCFLFWIVGHFSFDFKKIEAKKISKKKLKKYFFVMILCMIAVCFNFHGVKMFLYPYQNMMDDVMLHNITEWQNTSLSVPYHYIYYFVLLFFLFTMLLSNKKIRFIDFILFGVSVYLGLKSIRFWIFTPLIMSFCIFYYVKERKLDVNTEKILFVFSFLLCLFPFYHFINLKHISYKINLDNEVISLLREENPNRLFNMYDYGGELIYHDILVFVDGRADLYSPYNYQDYLNISKLEKDYVLLIDKYDFDYFLVDSNYPIYTYLKYDEDYQEIYHNDDVFLYKKIVNN